MIITYTMISYQKYEHQMKYHIHRYYLHPPPSALTSTAFLSSILIECLAKIKYPKPHGCDSYKSCKLIRVCKLAHRACVEPPISSSYRFETKSS